MVINIYKSQKESKDSMRNNREEREESRERSRSREKDHERLRQARQQEFMRLDRFAKQQKQVESDLMKKQNEEGDDDIDIFAENDDVEKYAKVNVGEAITDDLGYFNVLVDKIIGQKYRIVEKLGKGVFGVVVKGENIEDKKQYAIKILRKNEITEKSGSIEYKILSELPHDCHHIMKMYDYFHQDGHLCLVCELLSLDLRSYTQKTSVSLEDIRLYAVAMFLTIHEMKKSHIIHADIKPDNYLFRVFPHEEMKEKVFVDNIKLCDFGTSYFLDEHNWKRDEMVARYYRAPEIILGTAPNKKSDTHALDVWAVGCSLYELYTKKFLFNGNDNNQMLKFIMETKGKFTIKMLNKSFHREKYFDDDYNFLFRFKDKITGEEKVNKMQITITPERQLMNMLKKYGKENENSKNLQKFRDFLEKCLALNPKDRLKPQEALEHPFLHYQMKLI